MERRLAAILLTDMVGYSRLMGLDEEGTISRQKSHRHEVFEPTIIKHGGRIVKSTGDGILVEFPSAVDSVKCAIEVQEELAELDTDMHKDLRIHYRIGINLGDIVIDEGDILGDGVNVAARLEGLAEPGGICISGSIYEQLAGKLDANFRDAGEQSVKNVPRPVRVWHWQARGAANESNNVATRPTLPSKPSIAVLPFANMSDDTEQEYFADGIAEDVITALSRFRSLFVIARNSSFTYKGGAVDITRVGQELGVRYVVEGSVRKAGNRVRITAQLVDAVGGSHVWADRFDGNLDDIFDLQDRITEQIATAIEPEIQAREQERARRKPPGSLDAWELLQRGLSHFFRINESDRDEAIGLLRQAIKVDPEFAAPYAYLAYLPGGAHVVASDRAETTIRAVESARSLAEKAVALDGNEPMAHYALARVRMLNGETELALIGMRTSISLNPNFYLGHHGLGWAYCYSAGQSESGLPYIDSALKLNPRSPMLWSTLMIRGTALRNLGRHEEAVECCRKACEYPDSGYYPHMHLAAALAEAGQENEAQVTVRKILQLQPAFSISLVRDLRAHEHQEQKDSLLNALRKAGAPE